MKYSLCRFTYYYFKVRQRHSSLLFDIKNFALGIGVECRGKNIDTKKRAIFHCYACPFQNKTLDKVVHTSTCWFEGWISISWVVSPDLKFCPTAPIFLTSCNLIWLSMFINFKDALSDSKQYPKKGQPIFQSVSTICLTEVFASSCQILSFFFC